MKKRITHESIVRVLALQKQGLPNTVIAKRFGVHVSTILQALKKLRKP